MSSDMQNNDIDNNQSSIDEVRDAMTE